MISLYLWPGEGCESSELNFQKRKRKSVCSSFCKTQYAEQFVKCHLLVVQLLDMLKAEGFEVDVSDEGHYWQTRDLKVLAKNINDYTSLISSVFAKIVADVGLNSEDQMTEPEKKYLALRKAFEEKTGLEIGVFYHDRDEGDRYDDFFGRAWWVDGVYQYTPAGEKYKSKITRKSFVTYG